jgi:hypothetical protein
MTPFLDKLLRAGGPVGNALARFRKKAELIFLSKRENARRAFGRLETRNRKEMEAERIDRLRNPGNYQGR